MEQSLRVGIWIRVSTEDQAKGESPEHHEARARRYAELYGWDVITVYHLEGVSGKSVGDHPETKRMMKDVASGNISGLIFSKLARLARNTKQLIQFSEYFQEHGANLISLQEKIDTSSPAGRLFYTIIAAMAQWEREEIAERVSASVPIRAELGKPLGGQAPFGYQWIDGELTINETEAPIRRLMFELYKEHGRIKRVAKQLNERGYRTRKGAKFSGTTVSRLLKDPIAKGMRRANYTQSLGEGKAWTEKPKSEWVMVPAPAIVSEQLWEEVNRLITEREVKVSRSGRAPKHLFSGFVTCECGPKMYVKTNSKKYDCPKCHNKIGIEDLEEIFHRQLQSYIVSDEQVKTWLIRAIEAVEERQQRLEILEAEINDLTTQMNQVMELYKSGAIPQAGFKEHYQPLFDRRQQVQERIPQLEAEIAGVKIQLDSREQLLKEAQLFYQTWHEMDFQAKRSFVETITESIVISQENEIHFNLLHSPTTTPYLFESLQIDGKKGTQPQGFILAIRTKLAG